MALAIDSIIETVVSWLDGPELAECVVHHKVTAAATGSTYENIFDYQQVIEGLFETLTETCMTATTAMVGTQVRVIPPSEGHGQIHASFSDAVGVVSGDCAGAQECALVSKYTATATRRGRGRIYIPFVPEGFIKSGQITVSGRGFYEAAYEPILIDDLSFGSGGVAKPGVYSRTGDVFANMVTAPLRPVTCTQKRRVRRTQPFAS